MTRSAPFLLEVQNGHRFGVVALVAEPTALLAELFPARVLVRNAGNAKNRRERDLVVQFTPLM